MKRLSHTWFVSYINHLSHFNFNWILLVEFCTKAHISLLGFSNYTIKIPRTVIIGAETLALLNSALNPIFYGYFNVRVRKGFIEIVYKKKELNTERVYNGGLSGDTSYSSTVMQQIPDRTTQQLVLEMSEYGTYYRPRRSPRSTKRKLQFENPVARLWQQGCYCRQCYSDVALWRF